jgi:hypothetical protein
MHDHNLMEERMTTLGFLSAAAVLSCAMAAPAMAQHVVAHPSHYLAQSGACAYHEPGNPNSKEEDYIAWSGWRARGGWDDRNDGNCVRDSRLRHHQAGF